MWNLWCPSPCVSSVVNWHPIILYLVAHPIPYSLRIPQYLVWDIYCIPLYVLILSMVSLHLFILVLQNYVGLSLLQFAPHATTYSTFSLELYKYYILQFSCRMFIHIKFYSIFLMLTCLYAFIIILQINLNGWSLSNIFNQSS